MRLGLVVCMSLVAGGCSSNLSTEAPPRFDLSGDWVLQGEPDLPPMRDRDRPRGGQVRPMGLDPMNLPMLQARSMVIEQNADSMGIAYESGAYRDISWGLRKLRLADVRAGWDGPDLLIRTRTSTYDLLERYALGDDGQDLTLEIHLEPAYGKDLNLVRDYRRR